MDLLEKTISFCRQYGIHPARSKGQNFLIEENVYNKIIEAADLKINDVVLEVGPGLGFLTERLASKVKRVIAVELDDKLAEVLKARLLEKEIRNVNVVNEDILKMTNDKFPMANQIQSPKSKIPFYKIVANLPYNITSIFLRQFLSSENKPEMMVLMLQKEVAERIVAKPPHMSVLAISVQYYAEAEIIDYVPKSAFWPSPDVDSAIIKLKVKSEKYKIIENNDNGQILSNPKSKIQNPKSKIILGVDKEKEFFRLVKIGFSAKRKMLKNNLSAGLHVEQKIIEDKLKLAGFNPRIRAQELGVDDWLKLIEAFG